MKDFMKINENDNVIVALKEMKKGEKISLENTEIEALETIPAGHKMAVKDICEGADVIKYGFRIGTAKEDIKAGQWVHTHNIKTALGDLLEYKYEPVHMEEKITEDATFLGFQRPDGKVGVRNEIWIIPTVGCVNNIATAMAKRANAKVKGSVQEVIAFPHPYGCSQMGDDIFDSIVPTRTSFFADAQISRRKADVIIDHDHLLFRIHLVIIDQLRHALPAQVHIGLRFRQHNFHPVYDTFSTECLMFFFTDTDIIFLCKRIHDIKSDIMSGMLILFPRISEPYDQKHVFLHFCIFYPQ